MTTIAWDGETLASDSRETSANGIISDTSPKIYFFKKIGWAAAAGDSEDCELWFDWVGDNFKTKKPKLSDSFHGFFVNRKNEGFHYFDKCIPLPAQAPVACGSGAPFARASMNLGFDAVTAVKHAITLDHRSGGRIQKFRTKKHGK